MNFYSKIPLEIRFAILGGIIFGLWYYWRPVDSTNKLEKRINDLEIQSVLNEKWRVAVTDYLLSSEEVEDFVDESQADIKKDTKKQTKKQNNDLAKNINRVSSYTDVERDSLWAKISKKEHFTINTKD